jgi:hypothetical protein
MAAPKNANPVQIFFAAMPWAPLSGGYVAGAAIRFNPFQSTTAAA